jgi:hypothetical protein
MVRGRLAWATSLNGTGSPSPGSFLVVSFYQLISAQEPPVTFSSARSNLLKEMAPEAGLESSDKRSFNNLQIGG